MKRRWTRVLMVASIALLMSYVSLHGFAREIGRERRPGNGSALSTGTSGTVGMALKRVKAKNIAASNDSLVDDDKRLVPTGPNPLHNRRWNFYLVKFIFSENNEGGEEGEGE
jgi:hypothetical protein